MGGFELCDLADLTHKQLYSTNLKKRKMFSSMQKHAQFDNCKVAMYERQYKV